MDRFFVDPDRGDAALALEGAEAHHAAHVLRKRVGDRIHVFDGRGRWTEAEIRNVGRRSVALEAVSEWALDPAPRREVVLATAVPKAERFRVLVEKATELGVARIVPLRTERSVVSPRETKLDRLRQVVVSACKQCGRNRLLELDEPRSLEDWLADAAGTPIALGDLDGEPAPLVRERLSGEAAVGLLVGPEGGFTREERTRLRETPSLVPTSLGRSILRLETAAIALAAWFAVE